jgi:hypothetical protein
MDDDVWWMCMQFYVVDQPYMLAKTGLKIQYCRGSLEGHAVEWHMQWKTEAMSLKHIRSWT